MSTSQRCFRLLQIITCCILIFTSTTQAQFSRGTQMTFGKNRVQYNDFLWTFYRFKNFDTYYYLGGQELAIYAGRTADQEIEEIEKLYDYKINGRFQFLIYNKLSDFKQSNLGLEGDEQSSNTGGLTKIIDKKVLIYFDGNYVHFREQVRAGVAEVMFTELMYGGSIKNRIQAAVLLNLPTWYVEGLNTYIAQGWSVEDDNRMREGIISGKYKKFNHLAGKEAVFAGHSLWNFIVETYGSSAVSNLLYMTRINRNIETSFEFVLGTTTPDLMHNWLDYYQRLYLDDDKSRSDYSGKPIITIKKQNRIVSQVKVSPDGNSVAYVTNNLGKYKVWLYDTRKNKCKRIAKGGYKSQTQITDLSFPAIAWHPSGRYLTAIKEKKGKIWMDYYTPGKRSKRETTKFFYFDKVIDFSYSSTGNEMVMSAVQKGQSDIFVFNPRTKTSQQLTKDRWDDKTPRFALNDRYIVFSSTRYDDSLKVTNLKQADPLQIPKTTDLFLLDYAGRSQQLLRLTNTPSSNETQPMMVDSTHFTYLSDQSGIINRYYATIDSTISYIDTIVHYRYVANEIPQSNYKRNIITHDVNYKSTRYAELTKLDNKTKIYLLPTPPLDSTFKSPLRKTSLAFKLDKLLKPVIIPQKHADATITLPPPSKQFEDVKSDPSKIKDSSKVDISNYQFQSEFPNKKKKNEEKPKTVSTPESEPSSGIIPVKNNPNSTIPSNELDSAIQIKVVKVDTNYLLPKLRNYDIAFSPSYLVTQLDNNSLNETYQTYTGGAVYFDPGLSALIKIGLNDLFDDYKIVGGFRLSGNLTSNEYYVSFQNLKHRLDKQLSFTRQSREELTTNSLFRIHTHEAKYVLRWPFSDVSSVRGSVSYRNDRTVNLSTDVVNLGIPNRYQNWANVHMEYVYDNTISTGLNLYNGVRLKLFAESFKQLDQKNTFMSVIGGDIRYYQKIHRQIILANRFAASTSFGEQKIVYYLGSTDNAFTPVNNFNYNIQVDQSQNYAFQALASNMRGFIQNIRNGNSFALINSELRVPLFQYIINKPIKSDFIRNFQIVGFADVGTAWTGPSPYSSQNTFFKKEYPENPGGDIKVVITKDVNPIVGGYGFGLRSRLLGYFLRADWAWGVDNGEVQPRIFYFSLGLDF